MLFRAVFECELLSMWISRDHVNMAGTAPLGPPPSRAPRTEPNDTAGHGWTWTLDKLSKFHLQVFHRKIMNNQRCMYYVVLPKMTLCIILWSLSLRRNSCHHDAGHQQWPESRAADHICKEQMLSMHISEVTSI